MSSNRLQVFVSSKMQELADEREAIESALEEMGIEAFVFEHDAGARSQSIQQTFLRAVEDSDLYIGIFWKGYGAYTIEEFKHARSLGMDCLIYEKREGVDQGRDEALQAFLDEIGEVEHGLTIRWVTEKEDFPAAAKEDVGQWIAETIRRKQEQPLTLYVGVPDMPPHFVGRDNLMQELVERLVEQNDRVLSTPGQAGVGKTTLAVALCRHKRVLRHFRDGVLWGGLGKQPDVSSVLVRWGETLGIDVSERATDEERRQAVRDAISTRRMLIVMDDAWQLEAAQLLRCGGPACAHILTTRDESIAYGFSGHEQEQVPVLTDEAALDLMQTLAPVVWEEDEEGVRELTQRLGGLPLALELAGGYLGAPMKFRSLRTGALAKAKKPQERLALAKQRIGTDEAKSLQGVIEMSLEDLPEETQQAFYALGAFAPKPATFDLAAAKVVAGADEAMLSDLGTLNLVLISENELISLHQVVADVAKGGMTPTARDRHREHYLEVVNRDTEDWRTIEQVFEQIAWAWEASPDDGKLDMIWPMRRYLSLRGLRNIQLSWYKRGLAIARSLNVQEDVAPLLNNLGGTYKKLGEEEKALRYFQEALPLIREMCDQAGEASLLNNIGKVYHALGDEERALACYDEALPLRRAVKDQRGEATTLSNIGSVYKAKGKYVRALGHFQEALVIINAIDDEDGEATVLHNMGEVYVELGQQEVALTYFEEALPLRTSVGDRAGEARTRLQMAKILRDKGLLAEAIAHLKRVVELDVAVQYPDVESDMALLQEVEAELKVQQSQ